MTLSLKGKLVGGFGTILLVFSVAGLLSMVNLGTQRGTMTEIIEHDLPLLDELQKTMLNVQLYRKAEKDILLNIGNKEAQAGYLGKLKKISAETRKGMDDLAKAAQADDDLSAEVRKQPGEAAQAFAAYDDLVLRTSAELASGQNSMTPAEANAFYAKHKDKVHQTEKNLDALYAQTMKMLADNQKEMAELARKTELMLMISVVVGVLGGLAVAVAVLLSTTRPLNRVVAFSQAVAAGDLDAQAEGTFSAEMGVLRDSLDNMVKALKSKIAEADAKSVEAAEQTRLANIATDEAHAAKAEAERAKAEGMMQAASQLEKVVEIVSSAGEQLSAQIEQSSRGSEVQSARVGETATAMEEMNSTVLEVARSASSAAQQSELAKQCAVDGEGIARKLASYVEDVSTNAKRSLSDMQELGKQAEGIGSILSVISDIADQTNLLALNAAIEAARAGDAGRGFAVVADEVRKLAEKTMTATQEVGRAIREIQDGTRKNVVNVEGAVSGLVEAAALAEQTNQALHKILTLADETSDQVRAIATASEQQSATSEEINRSIEDINRVSFETSDAMRQSAQAVGELAAQTQNLRSLIEAMKRG